MGKRASPAWTPDTRHVQLAERREPRDKSMLGLCDQRRLGLIVDVVEVSATCPAGGLAGVVKG